MNRSLTIIFLISLVFPFYGLTAGGIGAAERARAIDAPGDKPPMFVLQVGIGQYIDKKRWASLSGSRTDVSEMKKLLTGERFNVPAADIRTLLDEQATKRRIFDEFQTHLIGNARRFFEKTMRRDAVVLFQFSGHGSQTPDADADETDGFDETFVTYDSRDVAGENFDITDDEIFALTAQLKKYTDNIVYILDSCHSGSGTRDTNETRRLPARRTAPVSMLPAQSRSAEKKTSDGAQTDLLPPGDEYIVISAAKSEQLAGQKYYFADEAAKTPTVYGYLTFYLIEELKTARVDTSYRELMANVRRKVSAEKSSQTPQLEGDERRRVFGGLASREDAFIRISDALDKNIAIEAGAMQNARAGQVLAIYDKGVAEFAGAQKIASAKITRVFAARSEAVLISQKRAITAADKAIIVAPDFGSARLKVFLDADAVKLTAEEKNVVKTIKQSFAPPVKGATDARAVDVVNEANQTAKGRWEIGLFRDEFAKVFPENLQTAAVGSADGAQSKPQAAKEKQVFYLAGRDFVPLYGFYVETDNPAAAREIEKALVQTARLRSVRAIANDKSPLAGKITVKPVRLSKPRCVNGKIVAERADAVLSADKTAYKFQPKEAFWLEITNDSERDLYVVLIDIGADASVKVLFPRPVYEERDGIKIEANGGRKIFSGERCADKLFVTTNLRGLQTYKLIASSEPLTRHDFEFLEMDGLGKAAAKETSLADLSDWTAVETIFEITAAPPP